MPRPPLNRKFVIIAAIVVGAVLAAVAGIGIVSTFGRGGGAQAPAASAGPTTDPNAAPTTAPATVPPVAPSADAGASGGYDVVAILGQSNAQGAGLPMDPTLDAGREGLDQLAGSGPDVGKIIPAVDSLYAVTHWTTAAGDQRVGPAMQFGRQLLASETTGRKVLLVPAAQGNTSITGDAEYSWDPANTTAKTNLYDNSVKQIDLALAQNPENRLVAIMWAQGESDAGSMNQATYQAKLLTILDGLRAKYGSVPFLIGAMVPEWVEQAPDRKPISAALQSIPNVRPEVRFIPGVTGSFQDEGIHYNAAGARAMGDRYWNAYRTLRPSQSAG